MFHDGVLGKTTGGTRGHPTFETTAASSYRKCPKEEESVWEEGTQGSGRGFKRGFRTADLPGMLPRRKARGAGHGGVRFWLY